MAAPETDTLRYAGFWPRFYAGCLDFLLMVLIGGVVFWGEGHSRLFGVYFLGPNLLFGWFYAAYLVKRFGGTPGKLMIGIRIRKVDGSNVGAREAILRYLPEGILSLVSGALLLQPILHMSDADYFSLSALTRPQALMALTPGYKILQIVQNVWIWSELIVLLTNRKRRALHDFIAGTVVVYARREKEADTALNVPTT